jgi:glutathione synthase/RimK-type ligase-like ATP-grasp enzyme
MNHPQATYSAEHKAIQLAVAHEVGFDVPDTIVSNSVAYLDAIASADDYVAVKGLDTVLVREGDTETFGYTNIVARASLSQDCVQPAPAIFQQALRGKLDLRVTVVGPDVFAVSVTDGGKPIEGDWRRRKCAAQFNRVDLPETIKRRCCQLISELGLTYGAIDLAIVGQCYYFIEVNPTGEWAWLVDAAGLQIDRSIADRLIDTSWIQPWSLLRENTSEILSQHP